MLAVKQVAIGYDNNTVLSNVSFRLQQGEIGCLLGPSGCGKTSLLRAICGFTGIQHGAIDLQDNTVSKVGWQMPVAERSIGMVFQDYALFPHLNVYENIAFGLHKLSKDKRDNRVNSCLELVNLTQFKTRMPHELSGGQQQRVAVARALAPKPKLLLLDEPFSSLDVALRDSLAQDVRTILKTENITALLVTHDQHEAFSVADTIGVFNSGKLHQWGDADSLYNRPRTEFVASFIGEGTLITRHNIKEKILIRPEHVAISDNGDWIGKVLGKQFRGSHFVYQLGVEGIAENPITLIGTASLDKVYDINTKVNVSIDFVKAVSVNNDA